MTTFESFPLNQHDSTRLRQSSCLATPLLLTAGSVNFNRRVSVRDFKVFHGRHEDYLFDNEIKLKDQPINIDVLAGDFGHSEQFKHFYLTKTT